MGRTYEPHAEKKPRLGFEPMTLLLQGNNSTMQPFQSIYLLSNSQTFLIFKSSVLVRNAARDVFLFSNGTKIIDPRVVNEL